MVKVCTCGATHWSRTRKSYALLVDSYVRDLFATGVILQRLDYEVDIANSGENARKIIDAAMPELVITEL